MRNNFFCTIIIPVYQVEQYIQKCLLSVVSQSYTKGIECILVNDCTKDESINIAQKLIDESRGNIKFRIINREENGGLSAARNTGILEAKGDYLYFLDSDDYITPDCIKVLAETAQKFPKAQIVQAGAQATSEGFEYLSMKSKKLKEYSEDATYIKRNMLMAYYPPTAWNKLVNREWVLANNLFFKEGLLHEDDYWNFFAAKHVTAYAICKQDTYLYNIRPGSITQAPNERNIKSRLISAFDFMNNIDDFCKKEQLAVIYKLLIADFRKISLSDSMAYLPLFYSLSSMCGIVGKIAIFLDLHLPKCILNTRLMQLFNDKIIPRLL